MGRVMFPRLIVGDRDAQGHQIIPQGSWVARFPIKVGSLNGYEYRRADDDLFVVARIASAGTRVLSLLFVPVPEGQDDLADLQGLRAELVAGGTIARSWSLAAGARRLDSLESDTGALATAVKAAWPAAWREYQTTDTDVPTGPRQLAELLA